PFGKEIIHCLARRRYVSGKDMVERAVLADDDDHVLDGRCCRSVVRLGASHQGTKKAELHHRYECKQQTCSVQHCPRGFLRHALVPPFPLASASYRMDLASATVRRQNEWRIPGM